MEFLRTENTAKPKTTAKRVFKIDSSYQAERRLMKRALDFSADNELLESRHLAWFNRRYEEDEEMSARLSKVIQTEVRNYIKRVEKLKSEGKPWKHIAIPRSKPWDFVAMQSRAFINDSHFMRTSFNTERFEEMTLADDFGRFKLSDYGCHKGNAENRINTSLNEMFKEYDSKGFSTYEDVASMSIGKSSQDPVAGKSDIDFRNWCGTFKTFQGQQMAPLQPISGKIKTGESFKSLRELATRTKCFDMDQIEAYKDLIDFHQWDFRTVKDINSQFMQQRGSHTDLLDRQFSDWNTPAVKQQRLNKLKELLFDKRWAEIRSEPWMEIFKKAYGSTITDRDVDQLKRVGKQKTMSLASRTTDWYSGKNKIDLYRILQRSGETAFFEAIDKKVADRFKEKRDQAVEEAFWKLLKKRLWKTVWDKYKRLSHDGLFVALEDKVSDLDEFDELFPESKMSLGDIYLKVLEPEIEDLRQKLIDMIETNQDDPNYIALSDVVDNISVQELFSIMNGSATGVLGKAEKLLRETELRWQDELHEDNEEACIKNELSAEEESASDEEWNLDEMDSEQILSAAPNLKSVDQEGFTYWHVNKITDPSEDLDSLLWLPENKLFREAFFKCKREASDPGFLSESDKKQIKGLNGFQIGWTLWNELQFAIKRANI